MAELKKSITEIFELYTAPNIQNAELIKAQALDLFLSYSDKQEFLDILADNPDYVKQIVLSLNEDKLTKKALVLLLNLSANVEFSQVLVDNGIVNTLIELILKKMKFVTPKHLTLEKAFYQEELDETDNTKTLTYNEEQLNKEESELLAVIGCIKHPLLILTNISRNSPDGRKHIIQQGSDMECMNVLILVDWLLNPQLNSLFNDSIDILMNLSSDEELRALLITKTIVKIFELFSQRVFNGDIAYVLRISGILRNLSYENDNKLIFDQIVKKPFIQHILAVLKSESMDETNRKDFGIIIIDIYLSLLTSETFMNGETVESELVFTDEFGNALGLLEKLPFKNEEIERVEALRHIYDSNKKKDMLNVD